MIDLNLAVSAAGPLIGVALGSWLTQRQDRRRWRYEGTQQQRAERRDVFARFVAAARMWQSKVLQANITLVRLASGRSYADAGDAFEQTLRALVEIRLIAADEQTTEAARRWEQALRALSTARAASGRRPVPQANLRQVKEAEQAFITAARAELTHPFLASPADGRR